MLPLLPLLVKGRTLACDDRGTSRARLQVGGAAPAAASTFAGYAEAVHQQSTQHAKRKMSEMGEVGDADVAAGAGVAPGSMGEEVQECDMGLQGRPGQLGQSAESGGDGTAAAEFNRCARAGPPLCLRAALRQALAVRGLVKNDQPASEHCAPAQPCPPARPPAFGSTAGSRLTWPWCWVTSPLTPRRPTSLGTAAAW